MSTEKQRTDVHTEPEMHLVRILDAPRDLVWKTWTEARHLSQWWGPKQFTNPICEWDTKKGNAILIHMQAPDGIIYPMNGEFLEVVPPERLVFISAALDKNNKRLFEVHNTVTFEKAGSKTKLIIDVKVSEITPEGAPYLDGMDEGWSMSIDKLEDYLMLTNL
jgi:uncharacterized protein YndB with AHSA1/START domain